MRASVALAVVALGIAACADPAIEYEGAGGVPEDENPSSVVYDDKADAPRYPTPTDLPELIAPEIIVSIEGLTVHLFDRHTGFQAVYPAGVGMKVNGTSITPVGHFTTSPNTNDAWWYIARRNVPAHFGGYPFLRITAENDNGANTYGLHGPITEPLQRSYVSNGCIRMAPDDIIRMFWMVRKHAATPVTFQAEVERDALGRRVDVGTTPALWAPGEQIEYGESVGPRPH